MPGRHIKAVPPAAPDPDWLLDAMADVQDGKVVPGVAAELAAIGEPARRRPALVAGVLVMAELVQDPRTAEVAPAASAEMMAALDLLLAEVWQPVP